MRVLFIQSWEFEQLGLMSLSSVLKKEGINVDILVDSLEYDTIGRITAYQPELICFSCTTPDVPWTLSLCKKIRGICKAKILFGGIHPTIFPEIIENPYVDIICRGDGEYALLELCQAMKNQESPCSIEGLWIKKDKIHKSQPRIVESLDHLPFPDYSLYSKYNLIFKSDYITFSMSRGCVYACSFCFNHQLSKLYSTPYARVKSPEYSIKEIEYALSVRDGRIIHFRDSIFGVDSHWARVFLELYSERIRIPFTIYSRPEFLDNRIVAKLKEAGCRGVIIGVETGNENLRNSVLNKKMFDSQLFRAARLLKDNNIELLTENMFGIPNEDYGSALKTVELNQRIGSRYLISTPLQIFPRTDISKNHLQSGKSAYFGKSIFSVKVKEKVRKIHYLFYFLVKYPRIAKLMPLLMHIPSSVLRPFNKSNEANLFRFYGVSLSDRFLQKMRIKMNFVPKFLFSTYRWIVSVLNCT